MDRLPYPITRGHWLAPEVRFHTGEVMPMLCMAYTTAGDPDGEPVLLLHGTNGSAASLLAPAFAGALFGPGQPLDAPSCPTRSARAGRPNPPTACAPPFRATTTATWWTPSTGC
jgi:pimeloyl-ACP methyl ester carboxylesterase